jgi:hypothetical protein
VRQVQRDASGRIDEDIACRSCGYNLRGLTLETVCPECRTAVERSVQGDLLRLCEPRWVERLAQGALWIILGVLGGIGLMLLGAVLGAILGLIGTISHQTILAMTTGVAFLAAMAQITGFWLLTTPDPGAGAHDERAVNPRTLARYCLVATVVVASLQPVLNPQSGALGPRTSFPGSPLYILLSVISIAAMIAQSVGYVALFEYARRIALRMPHLGLARQARIVMWGYLGMQILGLVTAVMMMMAMPAIFSAMAPPGAAGAATSTAPATAGAARGVPNPLALLNSNWFVIGVTLACILAPVAIVFQIWAIVLLFRFRKQFRFAADQARATWARIQ